MITIIITIIYCNIISYIYRYVYITHIYKYDLADNREHLDSWPLKYYQRSTIKFGVRSFRPKWWKRMRRMIRTVENTPMNLIEHLWIRWPSVELSQIINWIGLTSLINWVKIPQFCQPYLLMLIGNRLVKLNGPAASGRNHIFKICMLSLFSMSYPLAIKNGNGHSPVIIHLHLNSPVFSASPGFPAIFIPIVYA